jgi:serine/threonine-protein kinase
MQCPSCGHLNQPDVGDCQRCRYPLRRGTLITIGDVVAGEYRVEAKLGEGAVGQVYAALELRLGRRVALKVLATELLRHPTARVRMEGEATALARVDHPNVIKIHRVLEHKGSLVLVLELLSGGTLADRIGRGPLAGHEILATMQGILAGLDAIHAAGIVHRDVKPSNVLLTEQGTPKLADLGVAHDATGHSFTRTGSRLGTPAYMSPEQVRGAKVDSRSDIYACGVLLFELLAGRVPFHADNEFDVLEAHVHAAPDFRWVPAVTPHYIVAALSRALAKAPERRWQSAREFAAALAHPASASLPAPPLAPVHTSPPAVLPPAPPPRQRRGMHGVWSALLIGLVVGAIIVVRLATCDSTSAPASTPIASPRTTSVPATASAPRPPPPATATATIAAPAPEAVPWPRGECPLAMKHVRGGAIPGLGAHSFCLDETEVTVESYQRCVSSGACSEAATATIGANDFCNAGVEGREWHPINCVDWTQADAFCGWQRKRLPTASEWEYAARNGPMDTTYPWGSSEPSAAVVCAFSDAGTCPVKSKPTLLGLHDMAGNVWEWTGTAAADRPGCVAGTRVNRGGAWNTGAEGAAYGPGAFEGRPTYPAQGGCRSARSPKIGFRCAADP